MDKLIFRQVQLMHLHTDRPVAWGEKKDQVVYHLHQVAGEPVVLLLKGGCVQ